ncbi:MAG: trimethylamine methyltransferase family protein [Rhodoferax sp.]|nr:trimethylamine methyltransferase family protein [Rhodoferax sp.]
MSESDTQGATLSPTEPKRGRRTGGRERRDPNAKISGPAYIKRVIPTYDIMGEESLLKIEATADRILAEVGLDIRDDDEVLAMFKKSGAKVDGMRVKFEPGHLREVLKTAPKEFTQHARNPAHSVQIGGNNVVFSPAYGSPFVMDLDRGRRYGTLDDFQNFIKLAYNCPWLHHSGGTVCEPTDVPVNKRHLDMVYAHMRYSDKGYMGSITSEERAEDSIAMSRLLFGADFVDNNCVILGNVNVNSPLLWDGTMTKSARAYARANQAAVIVPFILGGAMGPVTNAGAIAQAHAETMVGCAMTQLERPGAPVIYGNFLSSMSLRSGSPTFGTPEPAIGSMVVGQLARRLNLPLRCAGSFTTSKLPDGQAMQESVMSMLSAVHCGANFILHSAGFLDGLLSMSYEKFMMDADFCGALHSYLAGVTVDDNTLAMDAFENVTPGGHYLGSAHTMANYTTAFYDSSISDDTPFETWTEAGQTDAATRANKRWKQSLADYVAPDLDVAVDESIRDFMDRKKASMPDQWY